MLQCKRDDGKLIVHHTKAIPPLRMAPAWARCWWWPCFLASALGSEGLASCPSPSSFLWWKRPLDWCSCCCSAIRWSLSLCLSGLPYLLWIHSHHSLLFFYTGSIPSILARFLSSKYLIKHCSVRARAQTCLHVHIHTLGQINITDQCIHIHGWLLGHV